jgi:Zn-dependent protease with chaperone function
MLLFSGILHDRQQFKQYAASVRPTPGLLLIQIETETGPQTLEWTLQDIVSAKSHDNGQVILQSGKKFLDITDPDFKEALKYSFPGNRLFKHGFFDRIGTIGCVASLLLATLPIFALYFWGAPYLADKAAQQVPIEQEEKIGNLLYSNLTAQYSIDTSKSALVQQFYENLGYQCDYNIRITVVHEPVINAFAVPGGHIVVFDSILGIMDAPEQLAALLAHEANHVALKHSTRSIFRQLANSLLISIFLGDYGDLSVIIAQQGIQLAGLSYSRQLEIEADSNGLDWMEQHGIPMQGMPALFRKMESSIGTESGDSMPDFLSTHPSIKERIELAEKRIQSKKNGNISPALQGIWENIKK